jgi:hypothetical protein
MTPEKLTKQLELLHSDLKRCHNRCSRISKAIGIEQNLLIQYAMDETQAVLDYIKMLKEKQYE